MKCMYGYNCMLPSWKFGEVEPRILKAMLVNTANCKCFCTVLLIDQLLFSVEFSCIKKITKLEALLLL